MARQLNIYAKLIKPALRAKKDLAKKRDWINKQKDKDSK